MKSYAVYHRYEDEICPDAVYLFDTFEEAQQHLLKSAGVSAFTGNANIIYKCKIDKLCTRADVEVSMEDDWSKAAERFSFAIARVYN